MVALHTSPLLRPGTGDAGGLNVYVANTAVELARRGLPVDVYTRATPGSPPAPVPLGRGIPALVHHLPAGPPGLAKEDLPAHLTEFGDALAGRLSAAPVTVLHTHYWLSGVAALPAAGSLGIPLVHTMHTMARVKNAALAPGDRPEPQVRVDGETALVGGADGLVANTEEEARALVGLYGADPDRVRVVHPGVDLRTFRPQPQSQVRARLGVPQDALVLLFVGRVQPLKAPDVLVRAAGEMIRRDPQLRKRLQVVVLGGLSGSGLTSPGSLQRVVAEEGLGDVVRLGPPVPRAELARWYAAADLLAVPSYAESFGLVAVEALACGTPVVAARVGGLPVAVGDAGVLVDGHEPADWADALAATLARLEAPGGRDAWARTAVAHAQELSWGRTVDRLEQAYARVVEGRSPDGAR